MAMDPSPSVPPSIFPVAFYLGCFPLWETIFHIAAFPPGQFDMLSFSTSQLPLYVLEKTFILSDLTLGLFLSAGM